MAKIEVGQDVWINVGTDTKVSWPIKARVVNKEADYYTVMFYDDYEIKTSEVYALDIYPDRDSLLAEYNRILDDSEKEFEQNKKYIDNYKK